MVSGTECIFRYMTDPSHGASVSLTIAYFRKHCINSVFINYIGDESRSWYPHGKIQNWQRTHNWTHNHQYFDPQSHQEIDQQWKSIDRWSHNQYNLLLETSNKWGIAWKQSEIVLNYHSIVIRLTQVCNEFWLHSENRNLPRSQSHTPPARSMQHI